MSTPPDYEHESEWSAAPPLKRWAMIDRPCGTFVRRLARRSERNVGNSVGPRRDSISALTVSLREITPRASCEHCSWCLVHGLQHAQRAGLQLKPQAHTLLSRMDRQVHVVAMGDRVLKAREHL